MLMPSIFGENMFDDFMRDFPFFDDSVVEKNGEEAVWPSCVKT